MGPYAKQSKRICWKALKGMTKPYWAEKPNETDLRIELVTGGTICVRGADNYDSLRGDGLDFLVLDEYACMAPQAWTEVLRPALADRVGKALFIGTPQGFNHFHELFEGAHSQPDWKAFQFTTAQGGNVPLEELQSAAQQLDDRIYRQEFEASFETLGVGRAYYAFDRTQNVGNLGLSPQFPLYWSLDFNMNPLCSVLAQVHNGAVYVLEEMVLPDSNTLAACEELLSRTQKWNAGIPASYLRLWRCNGRAAQDLRLAYRLANREGVLWPLPRSIYGKFPSAQRESAGQGSGKLRKREAPKSRRSTSTQGESQLQTSDQGLRTSVLENRPAWQSPSGAR